MNRIEIIEKLKQIESEFDVNSLIYNGVHAWPFIRLHVVNAIVNGRSRTTEEVRYDSGKTIKYIAGYLAEYEELKATISAYERALESRKRKSLFLLDSVVRDNLFVNGKSFHRFYDSLACLFPDGFDLIGLEYSLDGSIYKQDTFSPTFNIQHLLKFCQIKVSLDILERNVYSVEKLTISNIHSFYEFLETLDVFMGINITNVCRKLDFISELKKQFTRVITLFEAQFLFIVRFYNDVEFAACLAADEMGIPCIDIQHGQQGDEHSFYTSWLSIPDDGYALLPTTVAVWGEPSLERLNNSFCRVKAHTAKIIGNPLTYIHNTGNINFDLPPNITELANDSESLKVLVSLQPINIDWFLEELTKTILSVDKNIKWLIRNHTNHPKSLNYIEQINAWVDSFDDDIYIECKETSKTPLYPLLKLIDFNITQFSTVSYEALLFRKPSILLQINKHEHQNMLEDGFYKVSNCHDISSLIKNRFWGNAPSPSSYIQEFKPEYMTDLLK